MSHDPDLFCQCSLLDRLYLLEYIRGRGYTSIKRGPGHVSSHILVCSSKGSLLKFSNFLGALVEFECEGGIFLDVELSSREEMLRKKWEWGLVCSSRIEDATRFIRARSSRYPLDIHTCLKFHEKISGEQPASRNYF